MKSTQPTTFNGTCPTPSLAATLLPTAPVISPTSANGLWLLGHRFAKTEKGKSVFVGLARTTTLAVGLGERPEKGKQMSSFAFALHYLWAGKADRTALLERAYDIGLGGGFLGIGTKALKDYSLTRTLSSRADSSSLSEGQAAALRLTQHPLLRTSFLRQCTCQDLRDINRLVDKAIFIISQLGTTNKSILGLLRTLSPEAKEAFLSRYAQNIKTTADIEPLVVKFFQETCIAAALDQPGMLHRPLLLPDNPFVRPFLAQCDTETLQNPARLAQKISNFLKDDPLVTLCPYRMKAEGVSTIQANSGLPAYCFSITPRDGQTLEQWRMESRQQLSVDVARQSMRVKGEFVRDPTELIRQLDQIIADSPCAQMGGDALLAFESSLFQICGQAGGNMQGPLLAYFACSGVGQTFQQRSIECDADTVTVTVTHIGCRPADDNLDHTMPLAAQAQFEQQMYGGGAVDPRLHEVIQGGVVYCGRIQVVFDRHTGKLLTSNPPAIDVRSSYAPPVPMHKQ